ncbi:recombinase family protein [Sphingobium sp. KCTC 72723]|uniref:recombinase family protein n=1 Tax=Sphingobium sp. KCTC 72723 TaxID=2733867 RepID=UPI00165E1135|nr:recombinase family protein [Sphingobium sp. KCTC 72723]
MRVIAYSRFSSQEQGRGSTLVRQRALIESFCRRSGWHIAEFVTDEGVSAWTGANIESGNLGQLIHRLREDGGANTLIVVEKLDRLSRRAPLEMLKWLEVICGTGVEIRTVDGSHHITERALRDDPFKLIGIVFEAFRGHDESKVKSERVSDAWRRKREAHRPMTALSPAWLKLSADRSSYEIIHDRAAIVRRIFNETERGIGKNALATTFNREGVLPFGRGKGWHASYIQKIVRNVAVLGEFQPHTKPRGGLRQPAGDPIHNYFPPVISEDQFARVNDRRHVALLRQQGPGRKLSNLFTGIAKCGACGGRITFRNKGLASRADGREVEESYLVCDNALRGHGCTERHSYNYPGIREAILDLILHLALDDQHFSDPNSVADLRSTEAAIIRKISDLKKRQRNILRLVEGDESDDLAVGRYKEIQAELKIVKLNLEQIKININDHNNRISPAQHLKRVSEVRELMLDSDTEISYKSRSIVKAALNDIIEDMSLKNGRVSVILVAASAAIFLDRSGKNRSMFDLVKTGRSPVFRDPEKEQIWRAYMQRKGRGDELA